MDAIWFGCIPVLLADHYHPPLHTLLDWNQLAILIPEKQVSQRSPATCVILFTILFTAVHCSYLV